MATMVMQMHHNVMLYIHCLYRYIYNSCQCRTRTIL